MALSNKHCWIGLFDAEGNLRDNFLMYTGTNEDVHYMRQFKALCALGCIRTEHLFHSGCQLLAQTEYGLANLASVKPFSIGDYFRLIGETEHRTLVGDMEHANELAGIERLLAHNANHEADTPISSAHNDTPIEIPALDNFLPNLQSAPEWLKNYASFCIKSNSPYEIAQLVGLLARTGNKSARELGSDWAKKLSHKQLIRLGKANIEQLFALTDAALRLEPATNAIQEKQLTETVVMVLAMRDQCESVFWILEQANYPPMRDLFAIEDSLLSNPLLFTTPLTNKGNWMVRLLTHVREHSPCCWWAVRANLV